MVLDDGGNIWAVNTKTGHKRLFSNDAISTHHGGRALFTDTFLIARLPSGNFVVIARRGNTDPGPNPVPSRVIGVNGKTGAESLISDAPGLHYNLVSVAVAPTDGKIYVGDENVPDDPYFGSVIYLVNPKNGHIQVAVSNTRSHNHGGGTDFSSPQGITFSPQGQMFVLSEYGQDPHAPASINDRHGAVLAMNRKTGKQTAVLTSNYMSQKRGGGAFFVDPRTITRARNGTFYVVEDNAVNTTAPPSETKLIRVNPKTHRQSLVSDNAKSKRNGGRALFRKPYGVAEEADGNVLIVDEATGNLIRVNPKTGVQSLVASGMGNTYGLALVPGH